MAYFEQLHSGIRILQPDDCFRMSTDSVLVANFLTLGHAMRIADLGCGSGNITFLLAGRAPDCRIIGLELQPLACQAAQESVRRNALAPRVEILQADLRQIRTILPQHSFDAAVANPPYFPQGSGQAAASPLLAAARSEATCTLAQLLDAAAWLVKTGGRLALVYRPERLCDRCAACGRRALSQNGCAWCVITPGRRSRCFWLKAAGAASLAWHWSRTCCFSRPTARRRRNTASFII